MCKVITPEVQPDLPLYPGIVEVSTINAAQIEAFKDTYWAHTSTGIGYRDAFTLDYIDKLAAASAIAKADLRALLRHSRHWNENLQACVIPMQKEIQPDFATARDLLWQIVCRQVNYIGLDFDVRQSLWEITDFIASSRATLDEYELAAFNRVAPQAYREGMKKTKIFLRLCKALQFAAPQKSSKKLWNAFCQAVNGGIVRYNLYVSINPAHFLSMANPYDDTRGSCGCQSCHAMNGDYRYKRGCSGYACDPVSLIAFTAIDDGEALLNRKTARQVFFWHKGALIQSRLYSSRTGSNYGGILPSMGEFWENKAFRTAVQDLIAACLGIPEKQNKWVTVGYHKNQRPEAHARPD